MHMTRLRSVHLIHSWWKSKRSWLHTCHKLVIATRRLGLQSPLVASNQTVLPKHPPHPVDQELLLLHHKILLHLKHCEALPVSIK